MVSACRQIAFALGLCLIVSAQQSPVVISQPLATAGTPSAIAVGPDGALWFTNGSGVGRISATSAATEYPASSSVNDPVGLTAGPDGALWFTDYVLNGIGRMTTGGVVTSYSLGSDNGGFNPLQPEGITSGPDGALWFTEFSGPNVGRIATNGTITLYPANVIRAYGITTGPDGALWFTQNATYIDDYGNSIWRITTDGVLTQFPVPNGPGGLAGITTGPDGALWFTENYTNKIGRMTTAGVVTEYPTPSGGSPEAIVTGADGALWFTEPIGNTIGRITTAGAITEYSAPSPLSALGGPQGIAALPDGTIWFANSAANAIGEVVFPTAVLTTTTASVSPGWTIEVTGSGFAAGERVNLYSNSTGTNLLESLVAGASGTFSAGITVPEVPNGTNSVVAVGQTSAKLGVASYNVSINLSQGQIFADVPPSAYYYDAVNELDIEGITAGCGVNPALYCPTENVTRAEMAIFIVRALEGNDDFSYGTTPYFNDVPANAFGFQWIQKLYELGITTGCGNGNYCPNDVITRDEMAIMIIRARYGATTVFTYNPVAYFVDVPTTYYAFSWIQRLYQDGITAGCLASPLSYCPESPVTRGDMAILIDRGLLNQTPPVTP